MSAEQVKRGRMARLIRWKELEKEEEKDSGKQDPLELPKLDNILSDAVGVKMGSDGQMVKFKQTILFPSMTNTFSGESTMESKIQKVMQLQPQQKGACCIDFTETL